MKYRRLFVCMCVNTQTHTSQLKIICYAADVATGEIIPLLRLLQGLVFWKSVCG